MIVLGCDPGIEGAFARLQLGVGLQQVLPMPTSKAKINGRERRVIDRYQVKHLVELQKFLGATVLALEEVGGMSGQSGAGSFNFGRGVGWVEMAAIALGLRVELIRPQLWKSAMRVPAGEGKSRQVRLRASQVFPDHSHLWPLQKDDGKAEAALIAKFAAERMT